MQFQYPDWLGPMLFTGNLPWDDMQKSSMSEFLNLYSLHDSYFFTLHIAPNHYAVAVLRWDTWAERPALDPPIADELYPFLLIYIPALYQLRMGQDAVMFPNTIGKAECSLLTDEQRLALLNVALQEPFQSKGRFDFLLETPLCRTIFTSVENTRMELLHGDAIWVICLDDNKQAHAIPGLTKR